EGVRFALGRAAALRTTRHAPFRIGLQRRLHPAERDIFGQYHREPILRHRHRPALRAMDDRNRAAPVTLPRYAPVAQSPVHLALAAAFALEAFCQCIERSPVIHAVVLAGVDERAVFEERTFGDDVVFEFFQQIFDWSWFGHIDRLRLAERRAHRVGVLGGIAREFADRVAYRIAD